MAWLVLIMHQTQAGGKVLATSELGNARPGSRRLQAAALVRNAWRRVSEQGFEPSMIR